MKIAAILSFVLFTGCLFAALIIANVNGKPSPWEKKIIAALAAASITTGVFAIFGDVQ